MMKNSQTYQQDFDRFFSIYQGKRIAIYGTGQNARLIAEHISGYKIVGFISRDGTEGALSGQAILSVEEAVKMADIMIIAATASSTNIIYSRIKEIIPSGMKVLDLYGKLLNGKEYYKENPYWKKNYERLCQEIEQHDVVSFDVFDTLIMRMVLRPEGIFEMVENQDGNAGQRKDFAKWRIEAERICTLEKIAPTLTDIYEVLEKKYHLDKKTAEQLKRLESEWENRCIIPRKAMVELYRYALSCGKKVYFTSDMYFSTDLIRGLLEQCGIKGGYELLVSCEAQASKQDGSLFEHLKAAVGKGKLLHIGDHDNIDGEMAEKSGIDSFTILSAYDMLAASSFAGIFDCIQTRDDKNYLGYFASKMLNDPFALAGYMGKIHLSSYEDLALVIYPITMMFMDYIVENAKRYDCIIFPSRDGFFLYQLYNRIKTVKNDLPEAKYVYASRIALSRAAAKDEESFVVLLDKLFSDQTTNCKAYIQNQFDIELPEEYDVPSRKLIEKWKKKELIEKLKHYHPQIVERLEKHRIRYLGYLDALRLKQYDSVAIVDVVSYGTQVYCLSQLLEEKIDMIALGTTDIPNVYVDKGERVFSVYGNINKKSNGAIYSCSNLSVLHLFLEMLYASTDGQFMGISENQTPTFQDGSAYDKELITEVQRELIKIMEETTNCGFHYQNFSRQFSLGMMQLLLHKYSSIDEGIVERFAFSDPYMGGFKEMNLADML